MFRKMLLASAFGILMTAGAMQAEIVVRVAPPAAVVETRPVAPGPNYAWQGGYYRWNGTAHVWTPGVWAVRPRAGAVWVDHRWVRRGGGWRFVEGRWR